MSLDGPLSSKQLVTRPIHKSTDVLAGTNCLPCILNRQTNCTVTLITSQSTTFKWFSSTWFVKLFIMVQCQRKITYSTCSAHIMWFLDATVVGTCVFVWNSSIPDRGIALHTQLQLYSPFPTNTLLSLYSIHQRLCLNSSGSVSHSHRAIYLWLTARKRSAHFIKSCNVYITH